MRPQNNTSYIQVTSRLAFLYFFPPLRIWEKPIFFLLLSGGLHAPPSNSFLGPHGGCRHPEMAHNKKGILAATKVPSLSLSLALSLLVLTDEKSHHLHPPFYG